MIVNDNDIEILIAKDPILHWIFSKYGQPPNWQRSPNFVSLVQIILEQQVSQASAKAHFEKLQSYVGDITPEKLILLSNEAFKSFFVSRQKANYLRNISKEVLAGNLDFEMLISKSDMEVRESLTAIKGIGNWTANIFLMHCLQRKNIFLDNDIAIINAINKLYKFSLEELKLKWQPLNSLACYFLWHYYLSTKK